MMFADLVDDYDYDYDGDGDGDYAVAAPPAAAVIFRRESIVRECGPLRTGLLLCQPALAQR